jgi:hypothetical protein
MRCLNHNGLCFDLVVDSETARCHKPAPGSFSAPATSRRCPRARRRWSETLRKPTSRARARQA